MPTFSWRSARATRALPHLDPTEALEVSYHTPDALRDMVRGGVIDSMASVAGILLALSTLSERKEISDVDPTQ